MNQINAIASFCERESPEINITFLNVKDLSLNLGTQQRVETSQAHIKNLVIELNEGGENYDLEPIDVIFDPELNAYIPWDGFHRSFAYMRAERELIPAKVKNGTLREAILLSVGANSDHILALKRTNADKRKAVEALLKDPEWQKWSNTEIGKATKTSHTYVSSIRAHLETFQNTGERKFERNGKTHTMNISRIGGSSGGFKDGDYGSKQPAQISTNKTDYTHHSTIQPNVNNFTVRDDHIIPKSVLGPTETQSEKSSFVDQPKPIQNDLKEWFLGFMSRFYEFPDSYILAIEQKIKERKEMEAMKL